MHRTWTMAYLRRTGREPPPQRPDPRWAAVRAATAKRLASRLKYEARMIEIRLAALTGIPAEPAFYDLPHDDEEHHGAEDQQPGPDEVAPADHKQ